MFSLYKLLWPRCLSQQKRTLTKAIKKQRAMDTRIPLPSSFSAFCIVQDPASLLHSTLGDFAVVVGSGLSREDHTQSLSECWRTHLVAESYHCPVLRGPPVTPVFGFLSRRESISQKMADHSSNAASSPCRGFQNKLYHASFEECH